jgi:hypothetical protein
MKYDNTLYGLRHKSDGVIVMTSSGHPCVCPDLKSAEKILATFSDDERDLIFICEYKAKPVHS